jgi:hypothetical protein
MTLSGLYRKGISPFLSYVAYRGGDFNSFREIRALKIPVSTYNKMFLDTWNKNMYGLGVGISMVFKIFRQFPIYEGGG